MVLGGGLEICGMEFMSWTLKLFSYRLRRVLMGLLVSTVTASCSLAGEGINPECKSLGELLELRKAGKELPGFELKAETGREGDRIYRDVDLDNDGRTDRLSLSCGSGIDAICILFVDVATGRQLELQEGQMFLVFLNRHVLAIVGESLSRSMHGKRRAYRIDGDEIRLVCNNF